MMTALLHTLAPVYLGLFSYYSTFGGNRWGAHGVVEVHNEQSGGFEYICDEGWDINDAHVICRMLGYPGALDASVRSQYGIPNLQRAALSNVQCTGTENSIFDCPSDPNPSCDRSRTAGVRCLGNYICTIIVQDNFTNIYSYILS